MRRYLRGVTLSCMLTAFFLLSCNPAASQESPESLLIADGLKSLSKSIDHLTAELSRKDAKTEADRSLQKLDIAISYLNFRSRRIEMFERQLQSIRTSRNRFEGLMLQYDREEEALSSSSDPVQQDAVRKAREDLNFRRQVIKDRISTVDGEIVLLENKIMDMQSQIDSVETYVQQNLQF